MTTIYLLDLFGVVVFAITGSLAAGKKQLDLGASPVIACLMGMVTGVAGGMIRDLLSGEIPLILRREIYATASLCGAIVFAALSWGFPGAAANAVIAVIVTLAIRLAALQWGLALPAFLPSAPPDGD